MSRLISSGAPSRAPQGGATARALSQVSGALGAAGDAIYERQQRREACRAQAGLRRLEQDLQQSLTTAKDSIEADGAGFYESFTRQTMGPAIDAYRATIPTDNPEMAERLNSQLDLLADKFDFDAARTERDQTLQFQTDEIVNVTDNMASQISVNPENYDSLLSAGAELIDSSMLPAAERERLCAALAGIGLEALPSAANFVAVPVEREQDRVEGIALEGARHHGGIETRVGIERGRRHHPLRVRIARSTTGHKKERKHAHDHGE